jgi:hypothetical protein
MTESDLGLNSWSLETAIHDKAWLVNDLLKNVFISSSEFPFPVFLPCEGNEAGVAGAEPLAFSSFSLSFLVVQGTAVPRIHDKAWLVNDLLKNVFISSSEFPFRLFLPCEGNEAGVAGAEPLAFSSFSLSFLVVQGTAVPRIHSISCSQARYPQCRIRAAAHVG